MMSKVIKSWQNDRHSMIPATILRYRSDQYTTNIFVGHSVKCTTHILSSTNVQILTVCKN